MGGMVCHDRYALCLLRRGAQLEGRMKVVDCIPPLAYAPPVESRDYQAAALAGGDNQTFCVGHLIRLFRYGYGRHVDPLACGGNVLYGKHQRGLLTASNATAKPFHEPSAPRVVRDGGSGSHMLVDCERGDSLFVRRCSFVHHGKGLPSPCVA
jgi:hypothetical protein